MDLVQVFIDASSASMPSLCGKAIGRERDEPAMPETERGEGERTAVVTFRATPDMYKNFKIHISQIGARAHGETIAVLVRAARKIIESQDDPADTAKAASRRVLYEAVTMNGARFETSWGMSTTLVKVSMPELDAMDFKILKARLRLRTNEAIIDLLLALARNLSQGGGGMHI